MDKVGALQVILEHDQSPEEVERLVQSIQLLKGVLNVRQTESEASSEAMASARVRLDLAKKINEMLLKDLR